jgi:hypothetical protein
MEGMAGSMIGIWLSWKRLAESWYAWEHGAKNVLLDLLV